MKKLFAVVASIRGSKCLRKISAHAGLEVEVIAQRESGNEEAITCFLQKVALFLELAPGTMPKLDVAAVFDGQNIIWAEVKVTPEKLLAGLKSIGINIVLPLQPVKSSTNRIGEDSPDAVDPESLAREFGDATPSSESWGPRPGTPMPQALVDGEGTRLPHPRG